MPIAWWPRDDRYAERLAPGTKFADIIGEIDPAKLAGGVSMGAEDALHFGLIPRMHRGIFAMNELPELDELVQVGLFNILEERDVQIRGYPVKFDIDVLILFSANPATYNRSGKVIPQLKDRIGSIIHTHYPLERDLGIQIVEQEVDDEVRKRGQTSRTPASDAPTLALSVVVPYFMKELIEEISRAARKSKYIDQRVGRQRPALARQLSHDDRLGPAAGGRARRAAGRAADQRPRPPVRLVARQAGARHDGLAPDERAASARRRAGRGDRHRVRGIRRQARPGRDRRDLFARA